MKRHVIVGNGIAAISAALAIREHSTDPTMIVSAERCSAYSPMLTPYYIDDRIAYEAMFICNPSFYQQREIETKLGSAAVRVEPLAQRVYLSDGSIIYYDDLLIASGSHPLVPAIKGINSPGVYTLRTESDASNIKEALDKAKTVAIVGAGLIGIHLIETLHLMGKRIIVLEIGDHVLPAVLDLGGSMVLQDQMKENNIHLYLQAKDTHIVSLDGHKNLYLKDGTMLEADVIIMATGVEPNTDFIKDSSIKLDRGVLVDEFCRTNIPGIYAAGDVAAAIDPITGKYQVNPTWLNAVFQGRTAGLNMVGLNVQIAKQVRANIFSLFGLAVASIGFIPSENRNYTVISKRHRMEYRCLYAKENRLIGAILTGDVTEAGLLKQIIGQNTLCDNIWEEINHTAFVVPARVCLWHIGF